MASMFNYNDPNAGTAVQKALQPQLPQQPFNPGPINPGGVLQGPDGNRYGPTMPPDFHPGWDYPGGGMPAPHLPGPSQPLPDWAKKAPVPIDPRYQPGGDKYTNLDPHKGPITFPGMPRRADPNMGQKPGWQQMPGGGWFNNDLHANDWMHKYKPIRWDPPPNDGMMHPQVMHPVYSPEDQAAMFKEMMGQMQQWQQNAPPMPIAGKRALPPESSNQYQAIIQALGGLKGIF